MARLIKQDGTIIKNIIPSNGKSFSDEEMRKMVNTDFLNYIYIGDNTVMVCDEMCWMKPNPVLNVEASSYLINETRQWRIENNMGVAPPMAGDVLICSLMEFGSEIIVSVLGDFTDDEDDEEYCCDDDSNGVEFFDNAEEVFKDCDGIPFMMIGETYEC